MDVHPLEALSFDQKVAVISVALGILTFLVSIAALFIAARQLVALRRDIEQIASERKRNRLMKKVVKAPRKVRRLLGFDPRFTKFEWGQLIAPLRDSRDTIRVELSSDYDAFYRTFPGPKETFPRDCILLIDLVHIPRLLKEKKIASLGSANNLNIDDLITTRAEAFGIVADPNIRKLLEIMCTDQNDQVGALPVWINTHGRALSDPQLSFEHGRLSAVTTFDNVLQHPDAKHILAEAGVQSFYITFEFWAHLAYRGCRLFRHESAKAFADQVFDVKDKEERFVAAVADLATRLRFCNLTRDAFPVAKKMGEFETQNAFGLAHAGDARMIRENLALWKPVFSSELLPRAFPSANGNLGDRLSDDVHFMLPFSHRHDDGWSYLSALGGYGLALPAEAKDDKDSQRALQSLFMINPTFAHPYLSQMIQGEREGPSEVERFISQHARPRWPRWMEIEARLTALLFDLFQTFETTSEMTPYEFWSAGSTQLRKVGPQRTLATALEDMQRIAAEPDSFEEATGETGKSSFIRSMP